MGKITIGSKKIKKIQVGSTPIKKVYKGSTLIWTAETISTNNTFAVDLGLPSGTLWCTCDVGSNYEFVPGSMYQWGAIIPIAGPEDATWTNCPGNGGASDYDASEFATWKATNLDNNNVLSFNVDAAYQATDGEAVIPTASQFMELWDETIQEEVTIYNTKGLKCTSKINSNYIFLPYSESYAADGFVALPGWGNYWFNYCDDFDCAYYINFCSSGFVDFGGIMPRYYALPIRGVVYEEFIDLGLPSGTKWMKRNIGASEEYEYGEYFQWGSIVGYNSSTAKNHSTWATSPVNGGSSTENRQVIRAWQDANINWSSVSKLDGTLKLSVDAAYAATKGRARMPTYTEITELYNNTTHTWTTINGVKGLKCTSKSNSKYIFFPAGGYYKDGALKDAGSYGRYWPGTVDFISNDGCVSTPILKIENHTLTYADLHYLYHSCLIRGVKNS